jgi:hypothetical protein
MRCARRRPLAVVAACAALAAAPAGDRPPADARASSDALLADFHLAGGDGVRVGLWSEAARFAAQLVAALPSDGPERAATVARLGALARAEGAAPVRVLLLATGDVGPAEPHPAGSFVLHDPFALATKRLGLEREGDVVVVDRQLQLCWRGTSRGAGEAVAAVVAGTKPPEESGAPRGREIAPVAAPRVTFFKDVLPIVRAQCATCHCRDGLAPMDLTDAEEARGWAPMMAEVTAGGVMPPWSADPRYALCRNERRLTDTEKETIRLFAAQGAPAGDPPPGPAPAPETSPEPGGATMRWTIGEPDAVWELPHPEEIPAEGVLEYRAALVKTDLPDDAWIEALECRPTAPQVLHHLVALLLPDEVRDDQVTAFSTSFGEAVFGGYVPGAPAVGFPPGCARRLKKGQRFLLSIHYTTNGKPAVDRTRIGVRFARGPVLHEVRSALLATQDIDLAPGAAGVQVIAVRRIEQPIEILGFQVHMHARGVRYRYQASRDGVVRTLFDIPRFDWNWQHYYDLAAPIRIEAGDVLAGVATYDNSAANPRNPDPKARVKNGPQSTDEMMNGFYYYIDAPPAAATPGPPGPRGAR